VDRVKSPEDLGDFYLTPEVLKKSPESLLCGTPEIAIESSGTTGHASRVFLSRQELDYNARQGVFLKAIYGISSEDRILSTFDYGFCLDGLIAATGIPYWRTFAVCAGRVDPVEIYHKLPDYRFNIVMSGTPWLARFTEVAEAQGRPYPLKLLIGGGGGASSERPAKGSRAFGKPLCA
jgi:phenylacetate-coenzyme A ligase PaaK-like adenylate-forming protein